MASIVRPSTSYSTAGSTTYSTTSTSARRRNSGSRSISRPGTRLSRRTGSTIGGGENQEIICAISEARGSSPTIGLAFINLSTSEAVVSQIVDNSFYVRTINKINVFEPTYILIMATQAPPTESKLYSIVQENCPGSKIVAADRKYWSETAGLEYLQSLAFQEDIETLKVVLGGNYYATCCLSAALKYIEIDLNLSFSFHSLRIKYQPSEGTMMIDLATIQSLELITNLQDSTSPDCLFGLLRETLTPMGSRYLRSNILQPSTSKENLILRYDCVEELSTKEEMFFEVRQALKRFGDVDKLLTVLILHPTRPDIYYAEQSINNILKVKDFVACVYPLHNALATSRASLLTKIRDNCHPDNVFRTEELIRAAINEDVTFSKSPLDLRNQRTYAIKSGVNGLLDVARQTFKEATEDLHQHVTLLRNTQDVAVELRYDTGRFYYLRIPEDTLADREIPEVLINRYKQKKFIECQTLDLLKLNQRITDSHQEVVLMSDKTIQALLEEIRGEMSALFNICESVAMLDMLAAFAHLASSRDYKRPELIDHFGIKMGRHPIREKARNVTFVPNDFYATQQTRFQILTGCNMSGKSTYIRSIALITIMAQVGSFVPAEHAWLPLIRQLFARVSMDNSIEANVSSFAAEMRETAYILRNIDRHSMAIIDELGRGTSTRDGLAIALAIAEALVDSHAFVWFATHFRELAQILNERNGVVNMHLRVIMDTPNKMTMLYKCSDGFVKETHYGIALAKVVDLPTQVIDTAERVSNALEQQALAKKKSSKAFAVIRKRKLVLSLREALLQARDGPMEGAVLANWLRKLQGEFVNVMERIEGGVGMEDDNIEADEEGSQNAGMALERNDDRSSVVI